MKLKQSDGDGRDPARSGRIDRSGRTDRTDIDSKRYKLPKGYLFNYTACPHYFIEMFLYIILLLIIITNYIYTYYCIIEIENSSNTPNTNSIHTIHIQSILPMILCTCWVITNLTAVAIDNYHWYEQHFKIPPNWTVVIPFVW